MKKQIFLSTVLLLSCVVKADEPTTNVSNPDSNVACESVKSESTIENVVAPDITKTENIATEKAQDIKVAEVIQANIEGVTENCNTVFLNFKISKNKDNHNKQAWAEIIKATTTLIAAAEMHKNSEGKGDRIEEINKILSQSYEFLSNTTKLTGEANGIYGGYSIHLDIPQEYAQSIFPSADNNANK